MLLKLGRDVAPYEIYQTVHILMLLWQHAQFQSLPLRDWSKSIGGGVGRSREGVGHQFLNPW